MITLEIDQQTLEVAEGTTLLEAAAAIGVEIPTLCHLEGYAASPSCMVCMVRDSRNGMLLPACATRVAAGMKIETSSDEVISARRSALELLLSEHIGDCEGPCIHVCPAHMDIPLMIRQIEAGEHRQALITVKADIALPAVLGRICPAPCEKGCHRRQVDQPLAICQLKRFVADLDLDSDSPYLAPCAPASGRKVAVVGSGPAGLAAAYYLLQQGHACTIFDDQAEPGGTLRSGIPEEKLPRAVLDAEIEVICRLGAELQMSTRIGAQLSLDQLRQDFDAVVLTTGVGSGETLQELGIEVARGRARVDSSFQTSLPGVFTGGGTIRPGRLAVKSIADGHWVAVSLDQYLAGAPIHGPTQRFQSRLGRLLPEEHEPLRAWSDSLRPQPAGDPVQLTSSQPISPSQAIEEASRCLRCTCLEAESCDLRRYADQYQADAKTYRRVRRPLERHIQHQRLVYEPGKCISCGRCVRITEREGEALGLTFIGRGFDVRVGVPLNQTIDQGLSHTALSCAEACPTAALALCEDE